MMKTNKEKFSRLISGSQNEYTQAWNELRWFAMSKAKNLFSDSLREVAIDKAMDGDKDRKWIGIGEWIKDKKYLGFEKPWSYLKGVIDNRLKDLSEKREFEQIDIKSVQKQMFKLGLFPTGVIGYEDGQPIEVSYNTGWTAYQAISRVYQPKGYTEYPRISIDAITPEADREIMVQHSKGLRQGEIATKLKVTKQHVNYIEKKYLRPKKKPDLRYQKPSAVHIFINWWDYLLPLEPVSTKGVVMVKQWSFCAICKGQGCKLCNGIGTVIKEVELSSIPESLQDGFLWQLGKTLVHA
jgi:DNA-binding XRE family transcriptional regulator